MKTFFFLLFLTLGIFCTKAQGNKEQAAEIAENVRLLFNEKKYDDIYFLLSPKFRKEIKQEELKTFFERSLYTLYGKMESLDYIKETNEGHSFKSNFKNGFLQMNLSTTPEKQISGLSFVPFVSENGIKKTEYLSDNKKVTALDSLVDKLVKDHIQSPQNCGLSIGIIKDRKEFFYNYGEAKRGSNEPASAQTIYEIGSVSKVFCGILLAIAIEEKKVSVDDDIRKYLPGEYPNLTVADEPVRLIHLANHSSGLPRLPDNLENQPDFDPVNPYKNYSREMIFEYLKRAKLSSPPGKISEYSNIGMGLLGVILERVYGKPFEDLVKEKITEPFQMNATAVTLSPEQQKYFATGYNATGAPTPHWELEALAAAGALRSTPKDMMVFLKNNLNEKTEAIKLSHQSSINSGSNIGMAWHIFKNNQGNNLIWHNGGTFGFSGFIGFIKEKKCGVVILNNSGTQVDFIALQLLKYLQQ